MNPPTEGTEAMACPPCGVQPFLGLASYFAPLCYLFKDQTSIYSVARLMYARLWSRMNVITSDPGTLLHVCCTFESLLASVHLRLFLHLLSLGVQPLQVSRIPFCMSVCMSVYILILPYFAVSSSFCRHFHVFTSSCLRSIFRLPFPGCS
jgi:hypothetical protein